MKKLYFIDNPDYDSKKVVGTNMEDALQKYRKYVETKLSYDYSVEDIIRGITECKYVEDIDETEILW